MKIDQRELRWESFRSAAAGTHMTKTESEVRVTHLPTGICIVENTTRSSYLNREKALKRLAEELIKLENN